MNYNVLYETWIPVVGLDGGKKEVGLYELLRDAHRLKGITSSSPMVEYGIYRLVCAFIMDALRPRTTDLKNLLDEGQFEMSRIDAYLSQCSDERVSFDLFDKERPFLQSAWNPKYDNDKNIKSISEIDFSIPSGNNHKLFEHRPEEYSLSPREAARFLCTINVFCTAGLKGPSSVNGAPPLYVIVDGDTLLQTLVYSIVPQNLSKLPYAEPPVQWRNMDHIVPGDKIPMTSMLFGMTFPARRLSLIAEEDSKEIKKIYFQKGLDFQGYDAWTDPHVAYRFSDRGRASLKPLQGKEYWRNTGSLLDCDLSGEKAQGAPLIVQQYFKLCENSSIRLNVYGVATKNAAYICTQRSSLTYSTALLQESGKVELLRSGIQLAEKTGYTLQSCLRMAGGDTKEFENLIAQAVANYYSRCQKLFWDTLCPMTVQADINMPGAYDGIRQNWVNSVTYAAEDEFERSTASFGTGAKQLLTHSRARNRLMKELNLKGVKPSGSH